jgi:aminoglycoside 3'-phosphotransferase-1
VESCPFINDHHRRLIRARAHLDAGRVDEDDFGAMHDGWSAQQVWNAMVALLPIDVDPVVTHGDFSLDNVIVTKNEATGDYQVVGCLDVGRAGVADQYQDLAILHDCLGEFGSELQGRVFTQFGIAKVDDAKLRFHLALDEFF